MFSLKICMCFDYCYNITRGYFWSRSKLLSIVKRLEQSSMEGEKRGG